MFNQLTPVAKVSFLQCIKAKNMFYSNLGYTDDLLFNIIVKLGNLILHEGKKREQERFS